MSWVELSQLTVRYRDGVSRRRRPVVPVLDALDVSVDAGEWLGVIGPNGAGKSSLLKAIAGIVSYTGTITIDGRDIADQQRRARAALVAYVPQEPELPADMTGMEYVLLGRTPHISYFGDDTAHDRAVAERALESLDLAEFATRHLGRMSGGERQRAVLARALATEASVLLLDEPTSALDIGHQQQAFELVDGLRRDRGLTVIAAMHDLTLAALYSDRLVLVDRGVVIAEGAASEVLTEETIGGVYRANVDVRTDDRGLVTVTPRRRELGWPSPGRREFGPN